MRVYKPYYKWEDWINGMWRTVSKEDYSNYLNWAINFTGDHVRYGESMGLVIKEWENTMLHNLTNSSMNKRAFLGHCACCFESGCPEYIVRDAWRLLTEKQRIDADAIAQKHIDNWINEYKTNSTGLRKNMGKQMLLEWDS
jgi:lysine/ornithine N-monooxygenase